MAVHNFGDLTDENAGLLLARRVPDETGQVLGQLEGTKVVVLQRESRMRVSVNEGEGVEMRWVEVRGWR